MRRSPANRIIRGPCGFLVVLCLAFGMAAAADAAPAALAGRLLDAEGKPVVCGFVMQQESPRIWDWTDGKGRFRLLIKPEALPVTLLASFAGHEPQAVRVAAAGENLDIRLKRADPEFTKIEAGCAISISRAFPALRVYSQHRPLTAPEKECIQAWEGFLKEKGTALIAKLAAGTAWAPGEERYRFLLLAQMAQDAGTGLMNAKEFKPDGDAQKVLVAVRDRGMEALKKGLYQKPLTAEDVEALRQYRALQSTLSPNFPSVEKIIGIPHAWVGQKVQDIAFAEVLPLLASDRYTDHESLSLTECLRPEALASCLAEFDSYVVKDGKLAAIGVKELAQRHPHDYERFLSFQDMLKAERPVLLLWSWFEDLTHTGHNLLYAEYIKRAYRGRVDVYLISESSPDYTDTYLSERMFFGPNPGADPVKGLAGRLGEEDFTPFERAARMTKNLCLSQLTISPPVLQSLPGIPYRTLLDNWPTFLLLDKAGVSSVPMGQSAELPRKQWLKGWFTWYTPFEVSGVHHGATTERAIRSLLGNGGLRDPKRQHLLPDYPKNQLYEKIQFRIAEVDTAQRLVRAHRRSQAPNPPPAEEFNSKEIYPFRLRPDVRIELETKGKDGKSSFGIHGIGDLKPGMTFYADVTTGLRYGKPFPYDGDIWKEPGPQPYDISQFAKPEIDTVRIIGFEAKHLTEWHLHALMHNYMPLYGTVTARKAGQVTVSVDREHVLSFLGLRFWKEHLLKGDANIKTLGPGWEELRIAERLAVLKRWAEGADTERSYTFVLDPAVRLCRNGEVDSDPAALAVGDYVWVMYEQWWESQGMHREAIHPETIMAAEPMPGKSGQKGTFYFSGS